MDTDSTIDKSGNGGCVIVVSTGRTGTKALAAWMNIHARRARAWHEPFPSRILRPPCNMYAAGKLPGSMLAPALRLAYRVRRLLVPRDWYIEASPYLRSCVDIIGNIYDDPMVVHVVRDPRAYVVSYVNHGAFHGIKGFFSELIPYWQLKPEHLSFDYELRWKEMSQHERVCWRWNALNSLIEESVLSLAEDRYVRVRFEDIIDSKKGGLYEVVDKIGLSLKDVGNIPALDLQANQSRKSLHPVTDFWTGEMVSTLERHCGDRMRKYGYT